MVRRINQFFISKISTHPNLKRILLKIWNFYFVSMPLVLAPFVRVYAYLLHRFNSKVIAYSDTSSFEGVAFNPGALWLDKEHILLLAKSQVLPWFKARGNNRKFYLEGNPVIFLLEQKSLETKETHVLNNMVGFPQDLDFALEDFRAFYWKGQMMLNHSFVIKGKVDGYINQTSVRSALSVLDIHEKRITFQAFPTLDLPTQNFEKNWIYQEHNSQLLLFYSLNPYRVLVLENEIDFSFQTIVYETIGALANPGGFGTLVSYSTNPIDFDDTHWFIVIHQIDYKLTGRCYYHWGVLLDKSTFLPIKITSKPIFSGMGARGRMPGIRYISSVLKDEDKFLFFAGEGDVCVTVTQKTIEEINNLWIKI